MFSTRLNFVFHLSSLVFKLLRNNYCCFTSGHYYNNNNVFIHAFIFVTVIDLFSMYSTLSNIVLHLSLLVLKKCHEIVTDILHLDAIIIRYWLHNLNDVTVGDLKTHAILIYIQ